MRKTLRYAHILIAFLMGAYVYSPTLNSSADFQSVIQYGVFPLIALSGLAMWQQPRLMRMLRRS